MAFKVINKSVKGCRDITNTSYTWESHGLMMVAFGGSFWQLNL